MTGLFTTGRREYHFDSSSLIEAMGVRYPMENFPAFWNFLSQNFREVGSGGFFCTTNEVVAREIYVRDDDIRQWMKEHELEFVEPVTEEVMRKAREYVGKYPRTGWDSQVGEEGADPFVIAYCAANGAVVVTEESRDKTRNWKIPNVCREVNVRNINLLEFIQESGIVV